MTGVVCSKVVVKDCDVDDDVSRCVKSVENMVYYNKDSNPFMVHMLLLWFLVVGIVSTGLSDPIVSGSSP
jgi:hypothetical protein